MKRHSYPLIGEIAAETPWQILPSKLLQIRAFWHRAVAGERLSEADLAELLEAAPQRSKPAPGAIAVLPLYGSIFPKATLMMDISGGTSLDAFAATYRELMADPNVAAVVLDVNSPGGSVAMLGETAQILRSAKKKPLVAVANQMAASAAYRLAAQADEFVATPSALVGSVGTYMLHEDLTAALEMEGVKITAVQAGQFKTEDAPFRELSPEAEAAMQRMVDQFHAGFVSDVSKGRGVSEAAVRNTFGQGRLFTAQDALAAGMVDRVDTLERVIAGLLKSGGQTQPGNATVSVPVIATAAAALPAEVTIGGAIAEMSGGFEGGTALVQTLVVEAESGEQPAADDPAGEATGANGVTEAPEPEPPQEEPQDEDFGASEASIAVSLEAASRATAQATPTTTPKEGKVKTIEELVARQAEIVARQKEIDAEHVGKVLEADAKAEFDALDTEWIANQAAIDDSKQRMKSIQMKGENAGAVEGGNGHVQEARRGPNVITASQRNIPENPWALEDYRKRASSMDDLAAMYAEGAKRVNEIVTYETANPDQVKTFVERLLQADSKDGSFAQRMLITSDRRYDAAFGKKVMGRPLNREEENLINQAISIAGLGAETPVPVTIDPTVLLTSDGVANPLRAISRVVTITGNTWRGITSDGVTVDYQAELTAVDPQTPTFDAPDVTVEKAQAEVQFSIEVDQDWGALRSELATMFQDAKDTKEANKFLFGSGTDEPMGLITALEADGTSIVQTASTNALDLDDLDLVVDDLPPRFDANAQWIGNRGVFSALRSLAGAAGRLDFWVPIAQGFRNRPNGTTGYTLLDYPVNIASEMSRLVTRGREDVLILGDFSRGFVIVDRVGLNVELDPLVRNSAGKLIGARALYVYFRNTSALRTPNAFRMLQIKHT